MLYFSCSKMCIEHLEQDNLMITRNYANIHSLQK